MVIAGYQISTCLYESATSTVYRGRRDSDQQPVILKMLHADYPAPADLARFIREYELTRSLADVAGVIQVYALEPYQHTYLMVLEDFGGESLNRLFKFPSNGCHCEESSTKQSRESGEIASQSLAMTLKIEDFLRLSIRIADILGRLYRRNIIHKDLNPANIVWNPATDQVKIIDFGIASALASEQPEIRHPNLLEGTLAYMSPEQTGRMNRVVGYHTDLYSLGATMYHLLTGQLPFQTEDAMEMVHCHLAQMPVPPCEVISNSQFTIHNSQLSNLSAIIMKLLAKNAEDRYQSAFGLKADLEECLAQLHVPGTSEVPGTFELGQHDLPEKFQIPQKLYGREPEIALLLQAFERVSASHAASEMILISGYAGIGKSALVHEIHKPITAQRGYFSAGKFDQLQRNLPYFALVQAFQSLLRQILAEPETRLARWRTDILQAVGANGKVIMEVLPELELLLGPQPDIPELPPVQAQNRFHFVFQNFVRVCATAEHPLVLFLDDLQWADAASLKLIEFMLNDPALRFLLLIGAYRENEVLTAHPLLLTIKNIQQAGLPVTTLTLSPLPLEQVTRLLTDTLKVEIPTCAPIAEAVYQKTGGNPFFLRQFLYALHADQVIEFNRQLRSWHVNRQALEQQGYAANVLDLMTAKLRRLPETTQHVVQLAACIGSQFDLATLAMVAERAPAQTFQDLWEALQEGLIIPLDNAYQYIEPGLPSHMALSFSTNGCHCEESSTKPSSDTGEIASQSLTMTRLFATKGQVNASFKFLHDRVQQAAYDLIAEADKQTIHLHIGRLLFVQTPTAEREDKIFEIVNHLDRGKELITAQAGQNELAELNLHAGRKARASAAYVTAFKYFQVGLGLLADDCWQSQYDLTLALHVETTEAAYLTGDFAEMERLSAIVLQQARTLLEQVKVYEVKIEAYISQNKMLYAVQIALLILKRLGIKFPEKRTKRHILFELVKTRLTLIGKRIKALSDLSDMADSDKLAIMDILARVTSAAYLAVPDLFLFMVCQQVRLAVKYGNTSGSAFAYAAYGLILCGLVEDIDSGYQFGELALNLLERFNSKQSNARTFFVVSDFIKHWKDHIKEGLPFLQAAYQTGLETGDVEYATYGAFVHSYHSYCMGKELGGLERELASYTAVIRQLKQENALNYNEIFRQAVLNLIRKGEDSAGSPPCGLIGNAFNEEAMLPCLIEANDGTAIYYVYLNKIILGYLFQEYTQALENAAILQKYPGGGRGGIGIPIFYFYDSLTRLAVCSSLQKSARKQFLKKIAAHQKKMRKWAHHAPMNHLHKWYLVEAERARVLGRNAQAGAYYDQAIALAHEHQYLHEEALAHELAGRFYLAQGRAKIAQTYLKEARYGYLTWGAHAKVRHLDQTYPELLLETPPRRVPLSLTDTTPANTSAAVFDLAAVLKAAQTISGEIVLSELLQKMLRIVLANAGAQKGILLLEKSGTYTLEAESTVANPAVTVLPSIPLESAGDTLATAIVLYVARTKTPVVLADAAHEGAFGQDRYVITHQPQSILCFPLIHQGRVTGILYLENNLATGAFTPDHLEVLTMLAGQIAIALENAQLYATLEAKVQERTQALAAQHARLQATEARTRGLLNALPDMMFRLNREGVFLDYKAERSELYVHPDVPILNKPIRELLPPDVAAMMAQYIQTTLQTGAMHVFEYQLLVPGRGVCDYEARVVPSGPDEVIAIVRDITARKQAEVELQRARDLAEAANQAKTEFLSRVNHELRIPLNSILGYLQLFQQDAAFAGPYADALETMYQSSCHLLGLINNLLDLAKIEARKAELTPTVFHLPDFLKRLSEMARLSAQQKGLTFISDFAPDLPVLVSSDEHRLRQILLNLLNNAIKFTDHGSVTLRVRSNRFSDVLPQTAEAITTNVRFEVADTGIGIPAQQLSQIFLPFYQVNDARIEREGTGLGLTISQQLARILGSAIQVRSVVGQGTTFWFDLELPVVAEQMPEFQTGSKQQIVGFTGLPSCTLLVADDQPASRALVRDLLTPLGFQIIEAANGQEAVTLAQQTQPDVILMDVLMPQMDGLEATRRIRELDTGRWVLDTGCSKLDTGCSKLDTGNSKLETQDASIQHPAASIQQPVIIGFSANVSPQIRENCLRAGCTDFLPKPFQLEALLALLQRHLNIEWRYAAPAEADQRIAGFQPALAASKDAGGPRVAPPPKLLAKLLDLAQDGVITDIRPALDRIRALDARYNAVVDQLELLANNFQFDQMIDVINSLRTIGIKDKQAE